MASSASAAAGAAGASGGTGGGGGGGEVAEEDPGKLIAIIGDEDTVTGFLLAGVGQRDSAGANFLVVDAKAARADVEAFFAGLLARGDVGLIIISKPAADLIRTAISAHTATIPMVLEIPSTDAPYDPAKDVLMKRVLQMLGET